MATLVRPELLGGSGDSVNRVISKIDLVTSTCNAS